MQLKGWIKNSLIDYPGRISTIFFTGGCNFRCPICHNAALVLQPQTIPDIPLDKVFSFLERRIGLLDGVSITGGEPTLQPGLRPFLRRVRALGYAIKLDTNGYHPQVLAALLDEKMVDYVAMDVKAPPAKYAQLTGLPAVDLTRLEHSITLLRTQAPDYELRTTVVPGLLSVEDIAEIVRWIAGAKRYVLQQYRNQTTLDPDFADIKPYPPAVLQTLAAQAREQLAEVIVRGI